MKDRQPWWKDPRTVARQVEFEARVAHQKSNQSLAKEKYGRALELYREAGYDIEADRCDHLATHLDEAISLSTF